MIARIDQSRRNALHRLPSAVSRQKQLWRSLLTWDGVFSLTINTGNLSAIISYYTETETSISAERLCISKGFHTIFIKI